MTGNTNSALALVTNLPLDLSIDRYICPVKLVSITSSFATMAIEGILAVILMNLRIFQLHDFARFHPAGNIGLPVSN